MYTTTTMNKQWSPHNQWGGRNDLFLQIVAHLVRPLLLHLGRPLFRVLLSLTITGQKTLTSCQEPLLVVANHFSSFDALLLTLYLPFQPVFVVATESQRIWSVRLFLYMFGGIPVWRGQVDRAALRHIQETLRRGRSVCIFPEGGINPELVERVARGEMITQLAGNTSRTSGTLMRGKPGAAYVAVVNGVQVLPVAIRGAEDIGAKLRGWRRTDVTIHIGPVIGPFHMDSTYSGHQRRLELEAITDRIMCCIADYFPPEKRGPYQSIAPGRLHLTEGVGVKMWPSSTLP